MNLGKVFSPQRPPESLALIDCRDWQAPREYSCREIDAAADACARGLLARGFKPGQAIAILSANRAEFLIAYLGILRAGLAAVPVSIKFQADIVDFILKDASVVAIFCDSARRSGLRSDPPIIDFDDSGDEGFEAFLDHGPFEVADGGADSIAMVLYTSGSTGRPKGVPLTHKGHLWAHHYRLSKAGDLSRHRFLVAAPLFHMNALCTALMALGGGASVILLPEFRVDHYMAAIERFKCTSITSVPTMLAMCFAAPNIVEDTDVSSVEAIRMGSAPVSPKLWARAEAVFPGAVITNGYGTTEAGPVVFGPKPGQAFPPTSVGWPADGVSVKLVDASGNEAEEGELWQKTPAVMAGYLNLPDKSNEVLSDDGHYISGDVFRRDADNGAYYFVGRVDDMFNCGGENIYPSEVESVLLAHPGIEMACVVPIPDEIKGMKPVAFVVPVPGAKLDEGSVKEFALNNAPAFQHPRHVMVMDDLPVVGPGKVDRNGLIKKARKMWVG